MTLARVWRKIAATVVSAGALAALLAVAAPAADGSKAKSLRGTFVGVTSQFQCSGVTLPTFCGAANVVVSKSQKSINKFLLGWQATCAANGQVMDDVTVARGPAKLGRNALTFTGGWTSPVDLGGGYRGQQQVSFHGKLSRSKQTGSGTFSLTVTVLDPSGVQVDTCSTGTVTWQVGRLHR
jgi:hypothetical protein